MGGLEINLLFDKEEPLEKYVALKEAYHFDIRDGLGCIMSGRDAAEVLIQDDARLLRMIEQQLNVDLELLNYWNDEYHGKEIAIHALKETLTKLKTQIENNPDFHFNIHYGSGFAASYLQTKFPEDIDFLIASLNSNIENGATTVQYESY